MIHFGVLTSHFPACRSTTVSFLVSGLSGDKNSPVEINVRCKFSMMLPIKLYFLFQKYWTVDQLGLSIFNPNWARQPDYHIGVNIDGSDHVLIHLRYGNQRDHLLIRLWYIPRSSRKSCGSILPLWKVISRMRHIPTSIP